MGLRVQGPQMSPGLRTAATSTRCQRERRRCQGQRQSTPNAPCHPRRTSSSLRSTSASGAPRFGWIQTPRNCHPREHDPALQPRVSKAGQVRGLPDTPNQTTPQVSPSRSDHPELSTAGPGQPPPHGIRGARPASRARPDAPRLAPAESRRPAPRGPGRPGCHPRRCSQDLEAERHSP